MSNHIINNAVRRDNDTPVVSNVTMNNYEVKQRPTPN